MSGHVAAPHTVQPDPAAQCTALIGTCVWTRARDIASSFILPIVSELYICAINDPTYPVVLPLIDVVAAV